MEIRRLTAADKKAFLSFNQDLVAEEAVGNVFIEAEPITDFEAYLTKILHQEHEVADPNWSTVTTYFAFLDGQIAGKISCRWELEKGNLAGIGGHIGYVTAPRFRRQGVMKDMLTFAFQEYLKRGIEQIFITALEKNLPSRKTIESVGGVLQDIIDVENGKRLARYWVDIREEKKHGH
ncbi:GNAT family N-acetyltransferase [Streptococcus gallolyticus]|nr:GNAT family N-acetyltransferase [Streptococcus gallolyticus]MBY5040574.1 GNAT family N-acetyltransferase [Streptococcus gallolyticus]